MTDAEYDEIVPADFERLVRQRSSVPAEEVSAAAASNRERVLPQGRLTEGMLFLVGEVAGEAVGWIWVGLPGSGDQFPDTAWVYKVEVDPVHRGAGHGRSLMLAAEQELMRRGVPKVGLNVFGGNTVAIGLYQGLGYTVVSQQMSKVLIP